MSRLLIRNGHVVDPANGHDGPADVLVVGERIEAVGVDLPADGADVIDAGGLLVTPGLIDMHVHLREPGKEEEETIRSGAMSAIAGGITSVACFPNTEPAIDSEGEAEFVVLQGKRAHHANVFPVGAITLGLEGKQLAEMAGLARAGALAFSDADRSVESAEVLRRGMLYARMLDRVVISHCEDRTLRGAGVMNHGVVSLRLGLPGIPNAAEEIVMARDITLARITDSRLHVGQISTSGSVELLRLAKADGLRVTGDVTPHHFTLTDEKVATFDANYKMLPPLRSAADAEALVAGIRDDTIDVITSAHAPHAPEEKDVEFPHAPFGVIGMETLFPITYTELVRRRGLPLSQVISKLTISPARVLGLDAERGSLRPGAIADVSVFDIERERTVDASTFLSHSRNCPFNGISVRGTTMHVVVGGRVVFRDGALASAPEPRR